MSRELFKSMVYKDNKVYTRQCSNDVNPKNYDREENKGLTRLYQEKGQEDFEKYFLTNLILEGNVEILSGCNNTLRRLNYLANLLWKNKEFIKLRNKEDDALKIWNEIFLVVGKDNKRIEKEITDKLEANR